MAVIVNHPIFNCYAENVIVVSLIVAFVKYMIKKLDQIVVKVELRKVNQKNLQIQLHNVPAPLKKETDVEIQLLIQMDDAIYTNHI